MPVVGGQQAGGSALLNQIGLVSVPQLFQGHTDLRQLKKEVLVQPSSFRQGSLEGVVLRRENDEWLEDRAKLVHPNFTQAIDEHWRRKAIHWNRQASA